MTIKDVIVLESSENGITSIRIFSEKHHGDIQQYIDNKNYTVTKNGINLATGKKVKVERRY